MTQLSKRSSVDVYISIKQVIRTVQLKDKPQVYKFIAQMINDYLLYKFLRKLHMK
jgi:hypothetical protein